LIIDGGANIGMAAIWFAQTFADASLVCVEPEEANFDLLVRNMTPYGSRVEPIRGGLWPRSGQLRITNPNAGTAGYQVAYSEERSPEGIRAITIDEIIEKYPDHFLFYVKLDIEGAQKQLFTENTEWVEIVDVIAIELDDCRFPWSGSSTPVFKVLSRHEFDYIISGETLFCFRDTE
jgi:FkbM family methyltransferase